MHDLSEQMFWLWWLLSQKNHDHEFSRKAVFKYRTRLRYSIADTLGLQQSCTKPSIYQVLLCLVYINNAYGNHEIYLPIAFRVDSLAMCCTLTGTIIQLNQCQWSNPKKWPKWTIAIPQWSVNCGYSYTVLKVGSLYKFIHPLLSFFIIIIHCLHLNITSIFDRYQYSLVVQVHFKHDGHELENQRDISVQSVMLNEEISEYAFGNPSLLYPQPPNYLTNFKKWTSLWYQPFWAPSQYKDRLIYVWRFPC